jgi:hypothetical protein
MNSSRDKCCACFETRAFRALLSMRRFMHALRHFLILRSGPQDRVSKDGTDELQADLACRNGHR